MQGRASGDSRVLLTASWGPPGSLPPSPEYASPVNSRAGPQAPRTALLTHNPSLRLVPCVVPWAGECDPLWTASEHGQRADLTLQDCGKHVNLSTLHRPKERKQEAAGAWPSFADSRAACNLKNSLQKGNKKWGAGAPTDKV